HHDEGTELTLAEIQDVADVGVADAPGRGGLLAKTLERVVVARVLGVKELDGYRAMDELVLGLPDRSHATFTERPPKAELALEQPARERQHSTGARAHEHALGMKLPAVGACRQCWPCGSGSHAAQG